MNKRILVISGPTGVGESTVTKKIIKKYSNFIKLVAATTRPPRLNEKNKIDYYFFSEDEFKEEIKKGNILEYQNTRNGVYYGSYKPDLEEKLNKNYNIIVNSDIVGTKYFKKNYNATTIFITVDSMENLEKRHRVRGADTAEEEIEKRLAYAKHEIEEEGSFYDYQVVNEQDKLEETIKKIEEILKNEGYILKNS